MNYFLEFNSNYPTTVEEIKIIQKNKKLEISDILISYHLQLYKEKEDFKKNNGQYEEEVLELCEEEVLELDEEEEVLKLDEEENCIYNS